MIDQPITLEDTPMTKILTKQDHVVSHYEKTVTDHPLYEIFVQAIEQAMFGKGRRHGGNVTPFMEQPWRHYERLHGRGFLTGQAAKKLEEAASTLDGENFEKEVFGAMVYIGMAVLTERENDRNRD